MTTKLNQIIAIEKGAKTAAAQAITQAYHAAQKPQLFQGISKTYRPKDEDGDLLPPETNRVQLTVQRVLAETRTSLERMLDVVATKDVTNTVAKAPVVVDGRVIIEDVPATYLLFLEKQLHDLHTFLAKLPRLDPSERWEWDDTANAYASDAVETYRSKKVPRAQVLYEATDRHPAQVEKYTEDVVAGYWKTVKFSGALPSSELDAMLDRVRQLLDAVKQAREQANSAEVIDRRDVGHAIFEFVTGVG